MIIDIIAYLGFAIPSWFGFVFLCNYSTYHQYFKYLAVPLVLWGVLCGFTMFYWANLHSFFIWHLAIFLFQSYRTYRKQKKDANNLKELNNYDTGDIDYWDQSMELSMEKTLKYFILSVIIVLFSFAFSFLYFLNSNF
jgi:hypothetical protein